jgi:hypothetical protein
MRTPRGKDVGPTGQKPVDELDQSEQEKEIIGAREYTGPYSQLRIS